MSNILKFPGPTMINSDAGAVLHEAMEADLEGVVIMGYGKDGTEYLASSYADGGTVVWLAERLKKRVMDNAEAE